MIGKRTVLFVYASGILSCNRLLSHKQVLLYTPHLRIPSMLPKSLSRPPNKVGLMRALKNLPIHVVVMRIMTKRDTNII